MNSIKTKIILLVGLIAFILNASDASYWLRHPDLDEVDEQKYGTIMTFYWTFDPDNADEGWDGWTKGDYPQDPVHLQGTDITMPRNMANKFNLEGSGWYTEDGGHRVINIIEPHADPEETIFMEVPHVDYGLDAPHYHFGLVPFRTVAGVHDDIPAGTWVYIPMFKDIEIPVYDLNDRTQIDYTFWHDGWFRVSDISWSFADDATQIDIFGGTVQAVADVYNEIWWNFDKIDIWNETQGMSQQLDSYQGNVSFFYRADVPVFSPNEGDAVYKYTATVDTVHNDTKPHYFKFASGLSSDAVILSADIDHDNLKDDAVIYFKSENIIKGYLDFNESSITSNTIALWQKDLSVTEVSDINIADFNNDGFDDIVYSTSSEIRVITSLASSPTDTLISNFGASKFTIGDIDNDNINEIVIYNESAVLTSELQLGSYQTFSAINSLNNLSVSDLVLGDFEGEGRDDLAYGTETGIYIYSFSNGSSTLYDSGVQSPTDLKVSYIDPDAFADVYAVSDGKVLVKYSSHKVDAPFVLLGKTSSHWVNVATIDPRTVNYSDAIALSTKAVVNIKKFLKINAGVVKLPYEKNIGDLNIFSLNGKKLAQISAIKKNNELVYSLKSLDKFGKQPLLFSIKSGVNRISRMVLWD